MADIQTEPDDHRALAVKIADRLTNAQERDAVIAWAGKLLEIRSTAETSAAKAWQALSVTAGSNVVWPTAKLVASEVKRLAWDDRGLPARAGMGAAAVGAAFFGGQGAGIAALGTAIGVPLWVVLGAGGTFAGTLIQELTKAKAGHRKPDRDAGPVIDGDFHEVGDGPPLPKT